MTNDEKAKAYDMALESARKELGVDRKEWEVVERVLRNIFPELRESEDERIRKVIYKLMLGMREEIFTSQDEIVTKEKVLAYLEKQKDINCLACDQHLKGYLAGRKVTEEEMQKENTEGDFARGYDCGYECCLNSHGAEWFEKQKEQKPVEEDERLLNMIRAEIERLRELNAPAADDDETDQIAGQAYDDCLDDMENFLDRMQDEEKPYGQREECLDCQMNYAGTCKGSCSMKRNEQKPVEKQDYSGLTDLERAIHRGFLAAGLADVPVTIIKETAQDCLAHMPAWSEDDKKMIETICKEGDLKPSEQCWLKSLPERFNLQPKNEWSEDYREEDIQTRFAFYTYKDDSSVLYLSNVFVEESSRNHGFGTRILKAAEKVAEAVGATTISLKVKQDSPANAWYRKNGYGYVCFEDGYDWLEKNLEYLKPKKEVEWSEEDERMRNQLIYDVEQRKENCLISAKQNKATKAFCDGIEKCQDEKIAWLKSLRPQPQAEWSDEDSKRYISIGTALETSAVLSKEDYDANMVWLRDLVNSQKYSSPQPHGNPVKKKWKH